MKLKLYEKLAVDYAEDQLEYGEAAHGFEAGFLKAREMCFDEYCKNDQPSLMDVGEEEVDSPEQE